MTVARVHGHEGTAAVVVVLVVAVCVWVGRLQRQLVLVVRHWHGREEPVWHLQVLRALLGAWVDEYGLKGAGRDLGC